MFVIDPPVHDIELFFLVYVLRCLLRTDVEFRDFVFSFGFN